MESPRSDTLFDLAGGEPGLRRVVERFVDRVFDDVMIGYLFRAADRARVKQKEFEHAAEQLGGLGWLLRRGRLRAVDAGLARRSGNR